MKIINQDLSGEELKMPFPFALILLPQIIIRILGDLLPLHSKL